MEKVQGTQQVMQHCTEVQRENLPLRILNWVTDEATLQEKDSSLVEKVEKQERSHLLQDLTQSLHVHLSGSCPLGEGWLACVGWKRWVESWGHDEQEKQPLVWAKGCHPRVLVLEDYHLLTVIFFC